MPFSFSRMSMSEWVITPYYNPLSLCQKHTISDKAIRLESIDYQLSGTRIVSWASKLLRIIESLLFASKHVMQSAGV